MRTWTAWLKRAAYGLTICTLLSGVGNGQRPLPGGSTIRPGDPDPQNDPLGKPLGTPPAMIERQTKARNDERQKRLVADTEKLLQLATQLHEDVAKTDKNVLSMDVIHRADEIEKLAHAVKERMKG